MYGSDLSAKLISYQLSVLQLPPVCFCKTEDSSVACTKCHITANRRWNTAEMHTLSVSMRHLLDKEYSMFLEEIRERTPTQALVDKVLSKCQISEDQVMDHVTDASTTILCSHVKQTKLYNDLIFHKLFPDSSCHVMTPVASNVNSDTSSQGSARLTAWLNEDKFQTLTKVAIGAKVMLLTNVDSEVGATNGATGYVVQIDYSKKHAAVPTHIHVKLCETGHVIRVMKSCQKTTYMFSRMFTKHTFPLMLAYAITGHKSQGATLRGKTILHMQSAFSPGLAYVMLSRVTTRDNLKIVGKFLASDIVPMKLSSTRA